MVLSIKKKALFPIALGSKYPNRVVYDTGFIETITVLSIGKHTRGLDFYVKID